MPSRPWGRPQAPAAYSSSSERSLFRGSRTGCVRIALEPPSGLEAMVTSPPTLRREWRATVRPMPTPTVFLELTKGSNIRSRMSSLIPLPLSSTLSSSIFSPRAFSKRRVTTVIGRLSGAAESPRTTPTR